MLPLGLAAIAAAGLVVLLVAVERARQRSLATRRVAAAVGVDAFERVAMPRRERVAWPAVRVHVVQLAARVRPHDQAVRGPAMVVAGISALLGLASLSPTWIALAVLAAAAAYLFNGRARRRQRIEAQSLDAMQLLASGLRAGYSVPQAVTLLARQSPEPTASEFGLAAQELAVGVGLDDVMARLAERTANPDYELVSIIVRVQHEVGGNLAQILDSVSGTLRERIELRRQVNALTAQQRLSSIVLTILPFALLLLLFVMDRSFVMPLFTEWLGRVMLVTAGLMVFIGWTVMRQIGRVEV